LSNHKGEAIEFILVENSGDTRIEAHASQLRSAGFATKVIYTENHGFGAGCNRGAEIATGKILAFVNPDVEFRTSIADLEHCFEREKWGTVYQVDRKGRAFCFDLLPEHQNVFTMGISAFRFFHRILPLIGNFLFPVGSFFVADRDIFHRVGRFDERFFLYYEEAELARRLQARVGRPGFCRDIEIYHAGLGTQPTTDFAFRHEIKGLITYCEVTEQPLVFSKRLRALRTLSRWSDVASNRVIMMQELA